MKTSIKQVGPNKYDLTFIDQVSGVSLCIPMSSDQLVTLAQQLSEQGITPYGRLEYERMIERKMGIDPAKPGEDKTVRTMFIADEADVGPSETYDQLFGVPDNDVSKRVKEEALKKYNEGIIPTPNEQSKTGVVIVNLEDEQSTNQE